jgi:hypothetical protein
MPFAWNTPAGSVMFAELLIILFRGTHIRRDDADIAVSGSSDPAFRADGRCHRRLDRVQRDLQALLSARPRN